MQAAFSGSVPGGAINRMTKQIAMLNLLLMPTEPTGVQAGAQFHDRGGSSSCLFLACNGYGAELFSYGP